MTLLSYDTAVAMMLRGVSVARATETVALANAAGRVLAAPVAAGLDAPRHAVAVRDGYAITSDDDRLYGQLRTIVGESVAGGTMPPPLPAGAALRVSTGAVMPDRADRVVMQEDVTRDGSALHLPATYDADHWVRDAGSDFRAGDILIPAGTRLSTQALVTAAAADSAQVMVAPRPRVALIATGSELAAPGDAATTSPVAIADSLSIPLATAIADWGGMCVATHRLRDDLSTLRQAAGDVIGQCDILIIIGGASVGDHDHGRAMVVPHGYAETFARVAIKPGRPVWFGWAGVEARGTAVLGLPGNPASAMVTARLFLAPLIGAMLAQKQPDMLGWRAVPLASPLPPGGPREEFVRARWSDNGLCALGDQHSGAQAPLADAGWLIRRVPHAPPVEAGQLAVALPL